MPNIGAGELAIVLHIALSGEPAGANEVAAAEPVSDTAPDAGERELRAGDVP